MVGIVFSWCKAILPDIPKDPAANNDICASRKVVILIF